MNEGLLEKHLKALHLTLTTRGELKPEPVISGGTHPRCEIDGVAVTSFCSNSYLGLGEHPKIKQAAVDGILELTHSTSESRRLGGNFEVLEELEARLACFKEKPACLTTATGLLANVTAVHGLADILGLAERWFDVKAPAEQIMTIVDANAHESIRIAARLSTARRVRFRHNDLGHLEELLDRNSQSPVLVATDGVFSMEGDLAPLKQLSELCKCYGALLLVDDAHGTGVYGPKGAGTAAHFGVVKQIPILVATLSKALAGMGGAVLGDAELVNLLRSYGSGYRFTSAIPVEQARAVIAALDIMESDDEPLKKLWQNVRRFRKGLVTLGIQPPGDGPIIALRASGIEQSRSIENRLFERGFWCPAIAPPAVRPTDCKLRITISASHSVEEIDGLLNELETLPTELRSSIS